MIGVLLATIAVALATAQLAAAKPPPKGKYECVIGDPAILFGNLVVKSASTYTYRGKAGKYKTGAKLKKYPDGTKGYDVRFTRGPLSKSKKGPYHGHWYKATGGGPHDYEIALINPLDGFESIYCEKPK